MRKKCKILFVLISKESIHSNPRKVQHWDTEHSLPCWSRILQDKVHYSISIWPMNGTWTSTTTPDQSEPRSNGNERGTPYFPELQNWNLTTWCSLLSYPWHIHTLYFYIYIYIYIYIEREREIKSEGERERERERERHAQYNGYLLREWNQWSKFKSRIRLFAFHIVLIPLGKIGFLSFC